MPESFLINDEYFKAKDILECGQVFRYQKFEDSYTVFAKDNIAIIKTGEKDIEITCNNTDFFKDYFDLTTDYGKIIDRLNVNPLMEQAVKSGKGIRILKQDPFETLISFIISQNNHIPRIKSIIEKLCQSLGEKKSFKGITYYAFPNPEIMSKQPTDFYRKIGAGYRAEYLKDTAVKVASGFDLKEIFNLSSVEGKKKLRVLLGVGPKVADCILLFAYNKPDVFPVDTWIKKVYYEYFNGGETDSVKISGFFTDKFKELSGYAQQYLFYYKRNLN